MKLQGIEDIYELSPLQQGMLFHTLYEPESRLYFEQVVIPFEGKINCEAFERAWTSVADADTAIRTSFHWEEITKPVQVVHRKALVPVEVRDLRAIEPEKRDGVIEALLADDRRHGFDLQRAPLLRVTLVQLSGYSYRLVLSFHHIILDGWSLQLLVGQFSEAYAALGVGRTPSIPKSRPYSDHIRWLQKQDLAAAQNYWRRVLTGFEGSCRVVPDSLARASDFDEHSFELTAESSARLRMFAASQKLTLNTLVQGAWALLIHRLTGSADVVFGVTVSGRTADLQDVEKMVGLFINTVPLRTQIRADTNVTTWLYELQRQQFEARQFDYSPLMQIRRWSEIPGSGPLFDTLLAFENYPVQAGGMEGAAATIFVERTNYPISAAVVPAPRLNIRLLYNRGVLPTGSIRCIGSSYELILNTLSTAEHKRIGDLETLTEDDRAMFLSINRTRTNYPEDKTVIALWRELVSASPNAAAIEFGTCRMTYGELDRAARKLASKLQSLSVRKETPVAVLLDRSPEFIIAVLGILQAGGTYVPLDTAYPRARVKCILEDIGVKLLLTSAQYAGQHDCSDVVLLVETLLHENGDDSVACAEDCDSPDDAAYVMYTSGSTGAPKGIVVPHRAIVRLVRNMDYADIQSNDRLANLSNCAFDAATFEIWGALLNGACVVGVERETALSPAALSASLRRLRISILFITTALFNQMVADTPDVFSTLRLLLFGGEAVDPKWVRVVLQAGPSQTLGHVYGPTESTTFATWYRVTDVDPEAATVPIGRPISNTTAYVLNSDLNCVPLGGTGELYLGGDGVARGYHGKAKATAERFLPDPFSPRPGTRMYRTGDQVRWRIDGGFEFLGRLDKQVKIRGHRIELGEIERRLNEHPQIQQAVVVVRNDASGERSLAAYFVARDGWGAELQRELRALLREHLPDYMQPATLQRIAALPLNSNGKLDYAALPHPGLGRPELEQPFLEARDEVERSLVSIWQKVLGLERVGTRDGFFDIGGHSLRATQLVSRIRRELGVEIALRAIFERPTIAELAELIRHQAGVSAASGEIARLSRDERRQKLA
jgi:amino acid adenylation domain-containing protein